MNSHTLAKILEQLSDILLKMPDSKIDNSLFKILEIVNKQLSVETEIDVEDTKSEKKKLEIDKSEVDWDSLIKTLKENDLSDTKKIIEDANINTISLLSELAKRLNISLSGRPKKENIIYAIQKSLERDRVDETIRSRSKMKDIE